MAKSKKTPPPAQKPVPNVQATLVSWTAPVETSAPVVPVKPRLDALFRKIFWGVALFLLVFMPVLSAQYGITADEWVNKAYGEECLHFFTSWGENKTAVNYAPRGGEVQYCYGPTLDLISAAIYRTFNLEPYLVRHLLLSLMGILIIVSAGFFFSNNCCGKIIKGS